MKSRDTIFVRRRRLLRDMPDLMHRLVYAGTEDYPQADRYGLVVANIIGYLASISSLSYAVTYAMQDAARFAPLVWGNVIAAMITACVPLMHRFGRVAGAMLLTGVLFTTIFYFTSLLGRTSGIQLNYVGAAAVAFVVLGLRRIWLVAAVVVLAAGLHLVAWFLFPVTSVAIEAEAWFLNQLYFFSVISIMGIISVVIYYAFTLVRDAQAKTDALLLNIMPAQIAERLKANPDQIIADAHEEATILFADMTGFTKLSATLGPQRIVELLDELFSAFDALVAELQVEKIKTIGDAYMAVAGVPTARDDHAQAIARLAIGVVAATHEMATRNQLDIKIRVGMATGPVLAGVIGKTKFAYDVWGENVNLAARLESNGIPGAILVNDTARALLEEEFLIEPHRTLDLKGIGPTETWRLEGRK